MTPVKLAVHPRLAIAVLVSALALGGAASAGQIVLSQSNMPPALIPGEPNEGGDPETAALVVRIDRLEAELRRANGQIEELQNQNEKLEERFRRLQQDIEYRLGAGSGGTNPRPEIAEAQPPRPRKGGDAFDPDAEPGAPGAPRPIGTTPASPPLGTPVGKPPPPASAPMDLGSRPPAPPPAKTADAGPTVITGSGIGFTDGPRDQLNSAIAAYKEGQYADAEAQLKAFLAANPTHARAPDAIFYLGETFLQRSRPREAAEQYLRLSTDFAKSAKAPEGMMRLGQSLAMLGNNEQACATFSEVGKRYPGASAFVRKAVEREMQSHHCT